MPDRPHAVPSSDQQNGAGGDGFNPLNMVMGNMENDKHKRKGSKKAHAEEDEEIQCDSLVKNLRRVSFDQVAGNEEAKGEFLEIAASISQPEAYRMFGTSIPRGIMMTGDPGVGKTYMASALATTLDAPFYHVQVNKVTSMWFGASEKNLAHIFDHARLYTEGVIDIDEKGEPSRFNEEEFQKKAEEEILLEIQANLSNINYVRPTRAEIRERITAKLTERNNGVSQRMAVMFFDELDALGAARDNTPFQGGVSNRIVSVLLENLDGMESNGRILVVASTNRPEAVDEALRRAGRFDKLIKVEKPDHASREQMFKIHFKNAQEKAEREFVQVDYKVLGEETKDLVGADIKEIVRVSCQKQAIKWRDADEDEAKEAASTLSTEAVLEVIKNYRNNLRKKDPNEKEPMGFATKPKDAEPVPMVEESNFEPVKQPEPITEEEE